MKKRQITRRDFLRLTAGTAAALGSGIAGEARAEASARVVLIRSAEAIGEQGRMNGA
jgi:spermidine/putrescine-binding protein